MGKPSHPIFHTLGGSGSISHRQVQLYKGTQKLISGEILKMLKHWLPRPLLAAGARRKLRVWASAREHLFKTEATLWGENWLLSVFGSSEAFPHQPLATARKPSGIFFQKCKDSFPFCFRWDKANQKPALKPGLSDQNFNSKTWRLHYTGT